LTPNDTPKDIRKRWPLIWALATLPLLGWWLTGLFDLDEGFYGAVVAEMNRRGEWITPFYNGKPWFEKPILLYWLAKPCLALFGDALGPRLPSVLGAVGTYGVVAWFIRRRIGEEAAQWSVLALASSLLFAALGRLMMTDMPLALCFTAAMATFWESLVGDRRWRLVTAACLGLGVLAKGPVALMLFVPIAAYTAYREPGLRPAFRGWWLAGTLILAAIVATWYLPAYVVNGQLFVQKFLVEQNLQRFTGGDKAHTLGGFASLGLFIPVLLLGMLPWSLFVVPAWPRRSADDSPDTPLRRYLATWALLIFLFFSVSGAKLPHYVLPCAPPLAMLVGIHLAKRQPKNIVWAGVWTVAVAILLNAAQLVWYDRSGQAEIHRIARYVKVQGGAAAMYQMGRRQKALGTGKLKIQETSEPSVLMVLDATALDVDDFDLLLQAPKPLWVITRSNRIQANDFEAAKQAGQFLAEQPLLTEPLHYKLYRLDAAR
jgi:4-amino-4-deoxy-L-arabinose transferase-like glycosyltransferase